MKLVFLYYGGQLIILNLQLIIGGSSPKNPKSHVVNPTGRPWAFFFFEKKYILLTAILKWGIHEGGIIKINRSAFLQYPNLLP